MLQAYGVEITIEELYQIFNGLSSYVNRDRNAICLGLELININIQGWYTDIVNTLSSRIVDGTKVPLSQIAALVKCLQDITRRSAGERSSVFLRDIIRRWDAGELKNLRDRLDIAKIRNTEYYVEQFRETTKGKKFRWLEEAIERDSIWDVKPKEILDWERELDYLRENLNNLVSSEQTSVGCQQTLNKELFKRVRDSIVVI